MPPGTAVVIVPAMSGLSPPPEPPAWLPTVGSVRSVGFRPAAARAVSGAIGDGGRRERRRRANGKLTAHPFPPPSPVSESPGGDGGRVPVNLYEDTTFIGALDSRGTHGVKGSCANKGTGV